MSRDVSISINKALNYYDCVEWLKCGPGRVLGHSLPCALLNLSLLSSCHSHRQYHVRYNSRDQTVFVCT